MRGAAVPFFAGIAESGGVSGGVHFDVVLSDPYGIAIVQCGAFHAQIVHEGSIQAVEIFHHQASRLDVDARVIVRYGEIIHRQIIVG